LMEISQSEIDHGTRVKTKRSKKFDGGRSWSRK